MTTTETTVEHIPEPPEIFRYTTLLNTLKPTGYVMHQQVLHSTTVRSAHTVFMCFVFILEQAATCATYTIN